MRLPQALLCLTTFVGATGAAGAAPLSLLVAPNTAATLQDGKLTLATLTAGLFETGWRGSGLAATPSADPRSAVSSGQIRTAGGQIVDVELSARPVADAVALRYRLTPRQDMDLLALYVTLDLPERFLVGGSFDAGGTTGQFTAERGITHMAAGEMSQVVLTTASGRRLTLGFLSPTRVLLQDNRQWGPTFSVRIGPALDGATPWPAGQTQDLAFTLSADDPINLDFDGPVTITAGDDWIPLDTRLDIEPGSALDFSGFGQLDAPAGKHGRLIARPDGHLAFESSPDTPRRFYGVNLCFSAHYIPHDQADRLADRLMRLGYNAVRVHHYESMLVDRSRGRSTDLDPAALDQLDYLLAAFKKRGLYITTDMYVSRPVFAREIWPGAEGDAPMDQFKMACFVNDLARQNWKTFARNLLTHVNPYTGLTYAEDPALAWLSMINEANPGNFIRSLDPRNVPDWQAAWNRWLAQRYPAPGELQAAWGGDDPGDPRQNQVPLSRDGEPAAWAHDRDIFMAQTEREMFRDFAGFLRGEIGTRALLTNMNGWDNPIANQLARQDYDYVDDHFYVDHPNFLERPWSLPSRCDNASPVAQGAPGGRGCAFTRLLDRPFTISEYNYSSPGRFRGVGGIITGCMAALQDWSVVWRFAYSHSRENLFQPSGLGYFDMATDPLNQAAERASVCLFLRGDMRPADHALRITMDRASLAEAGSPRQHLSPSWNALALITRVGGQVADSRQPAPQADLVTSDGTTVPLGEAYQSATGARAVEAMRQRGWLSEGNLTDLDTNRLQSETGELLVDAPRDALVLDTPCTAGGYVTVGDSISAGALSITVQDADATVWVSSLDGQPIRTSRHLLVTHLTDLQNTGTRFGERARQTLLEWGGTPHLVRRGGAVVALQRPDAARLRAWALGTSGIRMEPVEVAADGDHATLNLQVARPWGACLLYEVQLGD